MSASVLSTIKALGLPSSTTTRIVSRFENGTKSHVPSLYKLVLHYQNPYSRSHATTKAKQSQTGLKNFVTRHLMEFAKTVPSVEIQVQEIFLGKPLLRAYYLNGTHRYISLSKMDCSQIKGVVEMVRDSSGVKPKKHGPVTSQSESIVSLWNPLGVGLGSRKEEGGRTAMFQI